MIVPLWSEPAGSFGQAGRFARLDERSS